MRSVSAQYAGSLYNIGKEHGDYLGVHGRPHAQAALYAVFSDIGILRGY